MKRNIHAKICYKCKIRISDGDVYEHFEEEDIFSNRVIFYAHNKCLK